MEELGIAEHSKGTQSRAAIVPDSMLVMDEDEVANLKKTLYEQCLVINRLYNELEEERKASASAADEALSMILRLQVEKAQEMMEACQYKRVAEEKMRRAEEALAVLEEVMYHKDMEIASLKYQLHAFKSRLVSVYVGKAGFHGIPRRNTSMPAVQFELLCSEMGTKDMSESICREIADNTDQLSGNKQHLICSEDKIKLPIQHNSYVLRGSYQQALDEPVAEADHGSQTPCLKQIDHLDCYLGHGGMQREFMDMNKVPCKRMMTTRMYHPCNSMDCGGDDISSQADAEHVKRPLLEDDRRTMKPEGFGKGKELLTFPRGISHDKLSTMESHTTNSGSKGLAPPDDSALLSLMEAMLCFWL